MSWKEKMETNLIFDQQEMENLSKIPETSMSYGAFGDDFYFGDV
jgi:hypothetical protein